MEYLDGKAPSLDKLKDCIRKGTLAFAFTPIVTGTAFKNKGVQTLLDAIVVSTHLLKTYSADLMVGVGLYAVAAG